MISQAVYEAFLRFVPRENVKLQEALSKHTTFRVGGEADCLILVENAEQLSKLIIYLNKVELSFFILGNGSNILVSDQGYHGIILKIGDTMNTVVVEGNRVIAGAGAFLSVVAKTAKEHSLTGLEFAAGIPGTVGGGVVMNAGAYDGEIKQVVEYVKVIDENGDLLELDNETMEFGYRTSVIKGQHFAVVECGFLLTPGNKNEIEAKIDDFNARRREKQPLEYASAGSTFKRPEGFFAGKLIMDAGLKGYAVGDAEVSKKHCGFVINKGNATASQIKQVIDHVTEEVNRQFHVELEPEVILLGRFQCEK